jgi:DNA topoisomerase-1
MASAAAARDTQPKDRRAASAAAPRTEGAADAVAAAKDAGLRYVSDESPGIRRRRSGKGFSYVGTDGRPISDKAELRRIKRLAIPPAWTDVWICPSPLGHIQATGRDARRRKQYRYHERWREVRDEAKYGRMIAFAQTLPKLRGRTARDLARKGLPREKVLAAVVRLLESTLIRVGNEEYARQNESFGLTTLRSKHANVRGTRVVFRFNGKAGVKHEVDVVDRRLARVVQRCQDLPGQELFQYVDESGEAKVVTSDDVNAYLRELCGDEITAKDFRTWAGTVLASRAFQELGPAAGERQAKKRVVAAVQNVATQMGNTPAVCRRCYIHPAILDAYVDGSLARTLGRRVGRKLKQQDGGLAREEEAVLRVLKRRLEREEKKPKAA